MGLANDHFYICIYVIIFVQFMYKKVFSIHTLFYAISNAIVCNSFMKYQIIFRFRIVTTSIQVYRGKSSLLEYIVGGSVSGAMYKANLGLQGVIVGGCLGI